MEDNEMIITNEEVMDTTENEEIEEVETEGGNTAVGAVLGALAGAGLTLAIIAGVKKGKEWWTKHKIKKQAALEATTDDYEDVDYDEVGDDNESYDEETEK